MKKALKVCWISAGVSSFIAGYLAKDVDKFIYIDVENQHPDSIRFIKDCEKVLDRKIEVLSSRYRSVQNVISTFRTTNTPYGAKCTEILKKEFAKSGSTNIGITKSPIFGALTVTNSTEQTILKKP